MSRFWERVLSACERLERSTYYEILGVSSDAGPVEIASRYYALVARLHPDRHARERDPDRREALTRLFARIGDAYRVLTDAGLRRAYDEAVARGEVTLAPESRSARQTAPERDPATELGRQLLEKGRGRLEVGDARGARNHLELASRYEPNSRAIAAALAQVRSDLSERGGRAARGTGVGGRAPSQTAAANPSVPAAETGRAAGPASGAASGSETGPSSRPASGPTSGPGVPGAGSAGDTSAQPAAARPLGATGEATLPPPLPGSGAPATESHGGGLTARAHPRVPANVRIRLKLPTWDRFETLRTRDLSRGGMFVRAKQPLAKGTVVRLSLASPSGRAVEIRAQVVRVVSEGEGAGMGLRFLEVPDRTRQEVDEILAEEGAEPGAPALQPSGAMAGRAEARTAGLELREVEPPEPRLHVREQVPARPLLAEQKPHVQTNDAAAVEAPLDAPGEAEAREGRELLAAGEFEAAVERFERAVFIRPDDGRLVAALHVARGYLDERAGHPDSARDHYESALAADPQCAEAIAALRRDG